MPAGTHEVDWTGSLASGVYMVRLQTGNAIVTTRMTVIR